MKALATQSTAADDTADSLAPRIVELIAAETGTDPLEIDPLYRTIDPDALERLFAGRGRAEQCDRSNRGARAGFTHAGCDVTVFANGEIEVEQLTADESNCDSEDRSRSTEFAVE